MRKKIPVKKRYILFLLHLVYFVNCNSVDTNSVDTKTPDFIGDFAPMAVGNEWVYKSESIYKSIFATGSIPPSGPDYQYYTTVTISIESIVIIAGKERYTFLFKEQGNRVQKQYPMPPLTYDTIAFDTIFTVTNVTEDHFILNPLEYLGQPMPIFINHTLPIGDTRNTNGDVEFELSDDFFTSRIYRQGTGMVFCEGIYETFGYETKKTKIKWTIVSFNGQPVAGY